LAKAYGDMQVTPERRRYPNEHIHIFEEDLTPALSINGEGDM
jgi:hypothetical protein